MSKWVSFSCSENHIREEFIEELDRFFREINSNLSGTEVYDSILWLEERPLADPKAAVDYLINHTIAGDGNRAVRYHTNGIAPSDKKIYDELCEQCLNAFNEYHRLSRLPLQGLVGHERIECGSCETLIAEDKNCASLVPLYICPKCGYDLRSPEEKKTIQKAEQRIKNTMTKRDSFFSNHKVETGTRWYVLVKVETEAITYRDIEWSQL